MPGDQVDRQELRKRRTRQAIQSAALELFAERGYRETTISDIAERADVAPRTVTVHFPAKEELLFDPEPFTLESLSNRLAARPPHESALEALRDWMATTMKTAETNGSELDGRFWERRALRAHVINNEPELRGRARASYHPFESVLAEAIGKDLGRSGNSLIPRVAALSAVAGLRELYESDEAQALAAPPSADELLNLVDGVIRFAQAGIHGGPSYRVRPTPSAAAVPPNVPPRRQTPAS
jgi:AcrR family transcriptional regulator